MEDAKTLLFYLLSAAGLIVTSNLFSGQLVQPEVEPPQPAQMTSTVTQAKSLVNQPQAEQEPCPSTTQIAFYSPDSTHLEGNRVVISGTVYASDFVTPLPNAPIEVLLIVPYSYGVPHSAFHQGFHTDEAGRYKATIPKPDQYGLIYLHYRAHDQAECPLTMQLFFLANPTAGHSPRVSDRMMTLGLAQRDPPGLVLRGPVDIVLPVSAPRRNDV
jgi:hypothetical protein